MNPAPAIAMLEAEMRDRLKAKDAEVERLRDAIRHLREQRDHFRDELLKIASAANAAALY